MLYALALLALAIPPGFATWRRISFETTRWAESDGSAPDIGSDR
jgi:hypothetical protein